MTTYEQALADMFGLFNTAWTAGTTAIVGYVPPVRWPGIEQPTAPDRSKFWARVSQKTSNETQSTLRNGDNGQRYTNRGTLYVQIFCPVSLSGSLKNGRKLAELARDAYRGKHSVNGVWFRNARILEMPTEQDWFALTVQVDYIYDETA